MQDQSNDSFFGFETRLPRDLARAGVLHSTATPKEPFSVLNMDAFDDLSLEELEQPRTTSFPLRRSEDPWMRGTSGLDNIDSREIFMDLRNSRSSSGFGLTGVGRGHDNAEPRSTEPSSWGTESPSTFFGDKEDTVEERIHVDLSGLMDDTDSFNSAQNREEFFNEFTKQTYLPYTPREEPMSMESSSKDTSPWGSSAGLFSSYVGAAWPSPEEIRSNQSSGRKVTASPKIKSPQDETLAAVNRRVPSPPSLVRTPMTLEELESQMMSSQSSTPRSMDTVRPTIIPSPHSPFQQPILGQRHPQPPLVFLPQGIHRRAPSPFGMIDPSQHRPGDIPRFGFIPIPGRMPHPGNRPFTNAPPLRHPYSPPRGLPERGRHPGNFIPPHGFGNGPPMHRGPPPTMFLHHGGPGFRGPRPMHGGRGMFPPPNRHMMNPVFVNQRFLPDVDNGNFDDDEEVTGWMTGREKDWVIKVQQSQVRTDNPYMDDYYYYVNNLKKSSKDTKGDADDFTEEDFILPARMASEPKDDRQLSNHFEGSLGKICISSVFNPRKTVDVDAINIAKNRVPPVNAKRRWFVDPLQKDKGHPKGLLLGIEELYRLVLELQDFSREIAALPEGQREHGIETRRNIINLIFDKLIQGATPELRIRNFCDTVKIRKGRDLLRRVLPILYKEQVLILSGYCVRALPVLMDIPADKLEGFDRCLVLITESLKAVSLKRLLEMLSPLIDTQHNLLNTAYTGQTLLIHAVKNKFALNFLSLFISRAEQCYDAEWSKLTDAEREKWTVLMTYLFISLTKASATDIAAFSSESLKTAVGAHLGRFPFSSESVDACRAKFWV